MSDGAPAARGLSLSRLKPPAALTDNVTPWIPVWSPPAALRAVRATVCVCGLFALTDKVIGNFQMALFAAFGSFATLVLASFGGTRRDKLAAHVALALAGTALITIGTLVSSSTALAAIVTVPVAFVVFFAGVAGPNAASGGPAALLTYVLPAASVGTIGMVPDRLLGWWMASVAGTAAVLLLSPRPGDNQLRAAAATLAGALADELDAALSGTATEEQLSAAITAKDSLMSRFIATPYRPTGLAAPDQALANDVELLEWCTSLVVDAMRERGDLRQANSRDRDLLAASSRALRDSASVLVGGDAVPDIEGLERSREDAVARLEGLAPERADFRAAARVSFHAHAITVAVLGVSIEALVAARRADPEWVEARRRRWYAGSTTAVRAARRVENVASTAVTHASVRSVWFVNSLRGALALAIAVLVADVVSVQHGFWVVLGTLSVLRTNASSTGATALRALLGTAIGFVVGGAILLAIGTGSTALWVVFPIAVFVAGYSPATAPFAVGQAAFTVTVAVLFNLLVPVGWRVGVVRIEDIALGCAVSVVVGLVFWPRGVASVVGDDLADAFRSGASYLQQACDWACGVRSSEPDNSAAAGTAGLRLDEALRGFLAEQGTKHVHKQDLWRLVGATMRLRLTARAVADLPGDATGLEAAREVIVRRANKLTTWYDQLAEVVSRPHGPRTATITAPKFGPAEVVDPASASYYGVWLCEHLDHLGEHLGELVSPATTLAEVRRRPWWR